VKCFFGLTSSFLISNKKDRFFIEKYGKVTVLIHFQEKIKRITEICREKMQNFGS
jgi:hypothetical protein